MVRTRINRSYQENTSHDLEHQTTKTGLTDLNSFLARFMPTMLPYHLTARGGALGGTFSLLMVELNVEVDGYILITTSILHR